MISEPKKKFTDAQLVELFNNFLLFLEGEIDFPGSELVNYFENKKKLHKESCISVGEIFFEKRLIYSDSEKVVHFVDSEDSVFVIQPEVVDYFSSKELKSENLLVSCVDLEEEEEEEFQKLNVVAYSGVLFAFHPTTKRLTTSLFSPQIELSGSNEFTVLDNESNQLYKFICESEKEMIEWASLFE
jgi:hypothetical protein